MVWLVPAAFVSDVGYDPLSLFLSFRDRASSLPSAEESRAPLRNRTRDRLRSDTGSLVVPDLTLLDCRSTLPSSPGPRTSSTGACRTPNPLG